MEFVLDLQAMEAPEVLESKGGGSQLSVLFICTGSMISLLLACG